MPDHWVLLALLGVAGWLVFAGMRVRELALKAGRDYCRAIGVQFLDETVSSQGVSLARDAGGQVRIQRRYGFEFTSDGERRYKGEIRMLGARVRGVEVELHRILH
jgi:hypothetical protein